MILRHMFSKYKIANICTILILSLSCVKSLAAEGTEKAQDQAGEAWKSAQFARWAVNGKARYISRSRKTLEVVPSTKPYTPTEERLCARGTHVDIDLFIDRLDLKKIAEACYEGKDGAILYIYTAWALKEHEDLITLNQPTAPESHSHSSKFLTNSNLQLNKLMDNLWLLYQLYCAGYVEFVGDVPSWTKRALELHLVEAIPESAEDKLPPDKECYTLDKLPPEVLEHYPTLTLIVGAEKLQPVEQSNHQLRLELGEKVLPPIICRLKPMEEETEFNEMLEQERCYFRIAEGAKTWGRPAEDSERNRSSEAHLEQSATPYIALPPTQKEQNRGYIKRILYIH